MNFNDYQQKSRRTAGYPASGTYNAPGGVPAADFI
jgi:hypothetical protein